MIMHQTCRENTLLCKRERNVNLLSLNHAWNILLTWLVSYFQIIRKPFFFLNFKHRWDKLTKIQIKNQCSSWKPFWNQLVSTIWCSKHLTNSISIEVYHWRNRRAGRELEMALFDWPENLKNWNLLF